MDQKQLWRAPKNKVLPDFIIGGAMKCGTTTLHNILANHPDIFIPKREVHFFDIDNFLQHNNFNFYDKENDEWIRQSMAQDPGKLWDWYSSKFEHAGYAGEKLIGEDSTTYLASPKAAERIAIQDKEIKMIFMLRHPTSRAYSNYLHLVRSGRATMSFEDTLRYQPEAVVRRSLYKHQLENYYKHIPRHRIKVILLEDLTGNKEKTLRELASFLEIDYNKLSSSSKKKHSNQGGMPRSLNIALLKNRFLSNGGKLQYIDYLPNQPRVSSFTKLKHKGINKVHRMVNPVQKGNYTRMKESTKEFLDEYFRERLAGLDELTNKDILSRWF